LDLSQTGSKHLGLRLPVVSLSGATPFQLTDGGDGSAATGTIVYNDGLGALNVAGIYVWDDGQWLAVTPPPSPALLESITLTSGSLTFTVGDENQTVSVATWTPWKNTLHEVAWDITGPGTATIINETNTSVEVVAGTAPGTNTLTATAKDGSGTTQQLSVMTYPPLSGILLDGGVYVEKTGNVADPWNVPAWTLESGKRLYVRDTDTRNPASSWANANSACTALGEGWRLPNTAELDYIYKQGLSNTGTFVGLNSSKWYWSSTAADSSNYWVVTFSNGRVATAGYNSVLCYARCVMSIE
jgi:hypothetical protein